MNDLNNLVKNPLNNKKSPLIRGRISIRQTAGTIAETIIDPEGYENLTPQDINEIAAYLRLYPVEISRDIVRILEDHIQWLIEEGEICPYCCYPIESYGCSGCGRY